MGEEIPTKKGDTMNPTEVASKDLGTNHLGMELVRNEIIY